MDKIFYVILFCVASLLPAHADDSVTMTTALPAGSAFSFEVPAGSYMVDWGDGNAQPEESTGAPVSGTLAGPVVKVSGAAITALSCPGMQLTDLSLSGAKKLSRVDCSDNQLTSLNVLVLSNLKELDCSNNQLSSLRMSSGKGVEVLIVSNNDFKTITASSGLRTLWVDGNQLSSLSLANAAGLESLVCDNNQIGTLTMATAGHPELVDLWLASNQVPELSLDGYPVLETVNVENNGMWHFTIGEIGTEPTLKQAFLGGNHLTLADMLPSTAVVKLCPGEQLEWETNENIYQVGDTIVFPDMSVNVHSGKKQPVTYTLRLTDGTALSRSTDYTFGETRLQPHILKFLKAQPDLVHLEATTSAFPGTVFKSKPFKVVDDKTAISAVELTPLKVSREGNSLVVESQGNVPVTVSDAGGRLCWRGIVNGRQRIPMRQGIYLVNGRKIAF